MPEVYAFVDKHAQIAHQDLDASDLPLTEGKSNSGHEDT